MLVHGVREPVCWERSRRPGKDSISAGKRGTSALEIDRSGSCLLFLRGGIGDEICENALQVRMATILH